MRIVSKITILLSLVTLLIPAVSEAASLPQIYFAGTTTTAAAGSTIILPLRVRSNNVEFNTVGIVATFPAARLQFVGLDKTGSYFDSFIPSAPTVTTGKVVFNVGKLGANTIDSDVLIGTLQFRVKTDTPAVISLRGSQAANNNGTFAIDSTNLTVNSGSDTNPTPQPNDTNQQSNTQHSSSNTTRTLLAAAIVAILAIVTLLLWLRKRHTV